MSNTIRKTALDRKMDRLLALEEQGQLKTNLKSRAFRKILANKLAVLGVVLFVIIVILSVAAPLFTKFSSTQLDLRSMLTAPNETHLFGTDQLGRDIWARMLYGGRISILVGFGSAIGAALIGVTLGIYVGYKGGWLDSLILKFSEIFMAFPQIIIILIVMAITKASLTNIVVIFILTGWPSMYRMTRSQILSIKEQDYIQALRAFGIGDLKICFKHMLPNAIGPIFVNITLSTAMFILQESALSYLGLGVPPEVATWGNILNIVNGRFDYIQQYWWLWVPTGAMLTIFILAINFIGDGLRDASDPTQLG